MKYVLITIGLLWILLVQGTAFPAPSGPSYVVFVSQRISPYIMAVEGLSQALKVKWGAHLRIRTILVPHLNTKPWRKPCREVGLKSSDVVVAVGRKATELVWDKLGKCSPRKIFTMVYNPWTILAPYDAKPCGVSLNIPCEEQIRIMTEVLPTHKRIGIVWSEEGNRGFIENALKIGIAWKREIVPIYSPSQSQVLGALAKRGKQLDALWFIPDRAIASESLVQLIIRQMLVEGKPVIGFNRFFYTNGAALAFILDYKAIGRQTAYLASGVMEGKKCGIQGPVFYALLNKNILKHLGIRVNTQYSLPIRMSP